MKGLDLLLSRHHANPPFNRRRITMLKSSAHLQPTRLSETAINASRQVWLASLGAAVVTRDWVQTEAGDMFKSLVKEGTVVESQAVRFVGHRLETSFSAANSVWKETRRTVESTVKQAADAAVSFAQQVLPRSLPAFELPMAPKARKAAVKTPKKAKRAVKAAGKAKRAGRSATKRA
jgi:hypothetical protein